MSETIPGMIISHLVITDNCRSGRDDTATFDDAVNRLRKEFLLSMKGWKKGKNAKFHIVASVEPKR